MVVTPGCWFSARFVFSARDVALLLQERAEKPVEPPTWLTLAGMAPHCGTVQPAAGTSPMKAWSEWCTVNPMRSYRLTAAALSPST